MPLGFERLNERSQRPNANINFIKPLASASERDQKIAKDFLERIAAQCYPVMKKDYISVMALEEYLPNPEFLGRNFNAGEVIQLVLKDKAGRWLSFKFVQMVMMHELAHCKQMNHSKFFWQVRNQYAEQMRELWAKKYEGEGLWGRGQHLTSGTFIHERMPEGDDIPEHLCGGTYRRGRGRKRKRGQNIEQPKLSYAERQQKRIAKKFGVHGEGQGLGEDELVRGALEQGRRQQGKPRVAGSKRGRELRANAALARFEAARSQQQREQTPDLDDGSETESEDDEWDNGLPVLDKLGAAVKDEKGRDMFKVCGEEEADTEGARNELQDLREMGREQAPDKKRNRPQKRLYKDSETESEAEEPKPKAKPQKKSSGGGGGEARRIPRDEESETESEIDEPEEASKRPTDAQVSDVSSKDDKMEAPVSHETEKSRSASGAPQPLTTDPTAPSSTGAATSSSLVACQVCSLENDSDSPTCMACSNVLKPKLVPNSWRCKSNACKGTKYLNAGDIGRCGLCGAQRPATPAMTGANGARPMGVTRSEVLRWD